MAISGGSPEGVAIPELGVPPLVDSETDLEDELPAPDDSLFMSGSSPEGVCLPGVVLRLRTSSISSWRRHCSMGSYCL